MFSSQLSGKSSIRLGIIANEFFDEKISRLGGFGMLSRQIARAAADASDPKVKVDLYWGDPPDDIRERTDLNKVYDRPLYIPTRNWKSDKLKRIATRTAPDVFLTIDYRQTYDYYLYMFQSAPLIMWVQDPKTPADWDRIATSYVPGQEGIEPQGLGYIDCTPLSKVLEDRRARGSKTVFTVPSPFLEAKIEETYGLKPDEVSSLCYPMEPVPPGPYEKSDKPTVVVLGRLDPQKRPWVIKDIAAKMPDVTFRVLGKAHFTGPGAWEPVDLPPNMELYGHVDGEEKQRLISSSWLSLNTAIHEGLPIAFVEGLQYEVPIVSCVNPERVPERFGRYVGEFRGTGLESVDAFVAALRELLDNNDERLNLGREGRDWVARTHSAQAFKDSFKDLCRQFDAQTVKETAPAG
ncbi:MAG: glycosyltransferase family 4 protein [Pseudomonadota bacterium]